MTSADTQADEFRLSRVLGRTVRALRENWTGVVLLAIPTIYLTQLAAAFLIPDIANWRSWDGLRWSAVGILPLVVAVVFEGWIALVVWRDAREETATDSALLSVTWKRFAVMANTVTLRYFGFFVGSLFILLPGPLPLFASVAVWLLWSLPTAVGVQACAVEQLNPFDAIARSFQLTRGRRWTIFWFGVVLVLPISLAELFIEVALNGWRIERDMGEGPVGKLVLGPFFQFALLTMLAAFNAVIYEELTPRPAATNSPPAAWK